MELMGHFVRRARTWATALSEGKDAHLNGAPSAQGTVDIFEGEWATRLGGSLEGLRSGKSALFEDAKLLWGIGRLGGVEGRSVLELGPLEAAHTAILENHGASEVLAVESNKRAYLRCLVVKELLPLVRSRFLCGDAVRFLEANQRQFDICVAAGILYHMTDPIELLYQVSRVAPRLYLWSHYYDPLMEGKRAFRHFSQGTIQVTRGFEHQVYKQSYQTSFYKKAFWGGTEPYSHWLSKQTILDALKAFGFTQIETAYDTPENPTGPALACVASR